MHNNIFEATPKTDMVSRTFHLHHDQLKPLQKIAKDLGISQSEIVRRSISLFLLEYEKRADSQKS